MSIIKKPFFLIPAIMVAAVALVSILAWVALKPIYQSNGFNRKFADVSLVFVEGENKDIKVIGISGTTRNHIYFKTTNPAMLWVTDDHLKNGKYVSLLNVPNNLRIASSFITTVDSPVVYIMAGNGPAVIKACLNGDPATIDRFPAAYFTRATRISATSFVFRGFDSKEKGASQIFIKGNKQTGELQRKNNITEKSNDAGITTDGYLNYDETTNLVLYVSYYRNRFFCLDTNLNLVYSKHTIDTVSTFQVEAGQQGNVITNTSPARIINGKGRVANGKLYNISKLQADNENGDEFAKNVTVDVYDIMNGEYLQSFYIPYYKREKVSDFKVMGNKLIVLYKNYSVIYQFPEGKPI